jgi:ferredoxin
MSGSGMTGEGTFQRYEGLCPKEAFFKWLDSRRNKYALIGPVKDEGQAAFRTVGSSRELFMEYRTTMLSPGKLFIYRPKEELFTFKTGRGISVEETPPEAEKIIIAGVHPCDTNAILYLDRTFLGSFKDPYYKIRRENAFIISLNCNFVSPNCFCSSLGAGPFLKAEEGFDMLLTDLGEDYLIEIKSERAGALFDISLKEAGPDERRLKAEKEEALLSRFKKKIDIKGLDGLLMSNPEHPVWGRTADERCLSCSNCVMVCPTCFCYDIVDETQMDMKTIKRYRQFDACQDYRFAEVHGGNFRARRTARLRQFVTHKLNHTHQYGTPGTVGCGRCITWCPTGIDLTEIAKEMQKT